MNDSELFFPYYIDQARLLDLYAILNGVYSEYEEIQNTANDENVRGGKAKTEVSGGFKMLKIGASIEGGARSQNQVGESSTTRVVQTTTSILSLVIRTLKSKRYIKDILDSQPGSFVIVPVTMQINSIKSLLEEAENLIKLGSEMQSLDNQKDNGKQSCQSNTLKQIKKISSVAHQLFGAEEIVCIKDNFAVFGNIVNDNLYQASRSDIVGTELSCLGQVKRIYPDGTQLMKNTVYSRFQNTEVKQPIIDSLVQMTKNGDFEYSAAAIAEVTGKPAFELQIVALYQTSCPTDESTPNLYS